MKQFKGFTESEIFTELPNTFFHQLLGEIADPAELKITLYLMWRVQNMDGTFRALRESDFGTDELGLSVDEIQLGIKKAVERGSILKIEHASEVFYFLNSPRGRATVEALSKGQWHGSTEIISTQFEQPNIFRLYEENIGPLTPLIADALKDAEEIYSAEWIADTIDLAVRNNKRSWKYCEAILKRWKEEGRGEKQDRRDVEKANRDDIQKRVDEFFKR